MEYLKEMVSELLSSDKETPMTSVQIENALKHLDHWEIKEDEEAGSTLTREFTLDTPGDAIEFVNRLNALATKHEQAPDIRILGRHVRVTCATPDHDGLHHKDLMIAAHANDLYDRWEVITGERDSVTEASDQSFPASDPPPY